MTSIEKMKESARKLISMAIDRGAVGAQAVVNHTRSLKIGLEKNDFNIATSHEEISCAVDIHKEQRKGSSRTNEMDDNSLKNAVDNAIDISAFSVADEHLCLPSPAPTAPLAGRFDPAIESLSMDDLRKLAEEFFKAARTESRISLDSGQVGVTIGHGVIMNSLGIDLADSVSTVWWGVMGMGVDGQDITSFDYLSGSSFRRQGVEEEVGKTANSFAEKILSSFGARKGESYKGKVILTPSAIYSLLLSPLHGQISGKQIIDNISRWGKAVGEKVASEHLTIADNPFDIRLGGATPFDSEGVPTKRLTVIEKGILKSHLESTYTAKRRGTQATGHGGFSMHGCSIEAGGAKIEQLRKTSPLLVEVGRFSGNVDPVSGNFSGVAKGSHLYKNGVRQYPLKETMIAGNFFEMIRNVAALSDDSECFCNSYHSPSILIDGISVSTG